MLGTWDKKNLATERQKHKHMSLTIFRDLAPLFLYTNSMSIDFESLGKDNIFFIHF